MSDLNSGTGVSPVPLPTANFQLGFDYPPAASRSGLLRKSNFLSAIPAGATPAAKLSSTTDTMIRVPRMHACPWHTCGFTVICFRQSTMRRSYRPAGANASRWTTGGPFVQGGWGASMHCHNPDVVGWWERPSGRDRQWYRAETAPGKALLRWQCQDAPRSHSAPNAALTRRAAAGITAAVS